MLQDHEADQGPAIHQACEAGLEEVTRLDHGADRAADMAQADLVAAAGAPGAAVEVAGRVAGGNCGPKNNGDVSILKNRTDLYTSHDPTN